MPALAHRPPDWELRTLASLGQVVRGGSPRPAGDPRFFNGDFIPWLTVGSLTTIPEYQQRISSTATELTEEGSKRSRTLMPGTLVIANSGATLGVAKILDITCCANDGIAALVNPVAGNSEFLCYYLNTQTRYLREVVAPGNGQPNLNTDLIGAIEVPFPSEYEQRAIATVIADADELIAALDALIEKKRLLRFGLMQSLLQGKSRIAGFTADWRECTYGDLLSMRKGAMLPRVATEGLVPVIAAGKSPAGFTALKNRNGPVVTVSASGASAGFVAYHTGSIWASDCSTIEQGEGYDLRFIYYSLSLRQDEIYRTQSGGAQPHVHPRDIYPLRLRLPHDAEEQRAIAQVLTDADSEISVLQRRLRVAQDLKAGIAQVLVSGQTRLANLGGAS